MSTRPALFTELKQRCSVSICPIEIVDDINEWGEAYG